MSSELLPEESASQQGSAASVGLGLQNLDLSKFLLPIEQYMALSRDVGHDKAGELLQFYREQQALVHRCISVQYGAVRSAGGSAVSSRSSNSFNSGIARGLGGLTGSRARSAAAASRCWRAKSVPDGLCYTKLFKDSAVQSCSSLLGKWPTVASLLRSSAVNFQSVDELERFRLTGDAEAVHVAAGGQDGFSFLSTFTKLAASGRYPVGSLGAVLVSSNRVKGPSMALHSRTAVGGVGGGAGEAVPGCSLSSSVERALDGSRPVPSDRSLTVASRMLGVDRSVPSERRWTFVQALRGCEPKWVQFVERDGTRYDVGVHTDGHSFFGLELPGSSDVMFPLYAGESATRVMVDLYHDSVSDVCFVSPEALEGFA